MNDGSSGRAELLCLETLEDIGLLADLWRDLDRRSTAEFVWFQSYAWCHAWIAHHTTARCQPCVIMLLRQNCAVAVLPLMRLTNRIGLKSYQPLGEPHTQYGNLLSETGKLTTEDAERFKEFLKGLTRKHRLVCKNVPEGSALEQVLGPVNRIASLGNVSSLVDLSRWKTPENYAVSLGKKAKKNLLRRRRQLEDIGTLSFEVLRPRDDGFVAAVNECVQIKKTWLAQTGRFGLGLDQSDHAGFLASIGHDGDDGPLAFVMKTGTTAAAIELGYLQRGAYISYMGSFRWDLRSQAPGRLQTHDTISWLIKSGVQSMDLLATPNDYKTELANRTVPLSGYAIANGPGTALYTRVWTSWAKPTLKRTLTSMPLGLRKTLNGLRGKQRNLEV